GKVVLIAFRAPWSESCRNMTPVLNDVYSQYKTNGLVLLDFMKLYGTYADEIETGKKVTETEEITLLKGYIKRHGITHPVAISTEGLAFDDFKVTGIPALFFIDRAGDINDIRIGSGHPQRIHDKIKKLLEEK
ncbi:MAG: TlpA family protein disulfide reductase, partial [bacterium]|nr:TlpA family protein disulfide reductase [bacterium]